MRPEKQVSLIGKPLAGHGAWLQAGSKSGSQRETIYPMSYILSVDKLPNQITKMRSL